MEQNFEIPYNKLAPSPPSSPLGERKLGAGKL